jgi:hypothetical protein
MLSRPTESADCRPTLSFEDRHFADESVYSAVALPLLVARHIAQVVVGDGLHEAGPEQ